MWNIKYMAGNKVVVLYLMLNPELLDTIPNKIEKINIDENKNFR